MKNNCVLALLNFATKILWRATSTPAVFLLVCLAKDTILFQTDLCLKKGMIVKMDNQTKERIVEFNKRFGLKTEFITDESVLGYALNNTIYINESIEQDYERTNKHELLHFFEETEEFQRLKQEVLDANRENLEQIGSEYELRYFGLYSEDEINAGVLDNEIVIDLLIDNSVIEYDEGLLVGDAFLFFF